MRACEETKRRKIQKIQTHAWRLAADAFRGSRSRRFVRALYYV